MDSRDVTIDGKSYALVDKLVAQKVINELLEAHKFPPSRIMELVAEIKGKNSS